MDLDCDVPRWFVQIYNWFSDGKITPDNMEYLIEWYIKKGIIICTELITI